jgi:hypothetical protein
VSSLNISAFRVASALATPAKRPYQDRVTGLDRADGTDEREAGRMRSLPGFVDLFLYRCSAMDLFPVRICSALTNSLAKPHTRSRLHPPALGRERLPERLLHVEQFCRFASFLRFCAFLQEEPNQNQSPRELSRETRQIRYGFRT